MRNAKDYVATGSIGLPKNPIEVLNVEVQHHMMEVIKELRSTFDIYDVTLGAETSIDHHGNRSAYIKGDWNGRPIGGEDGVYAAFNGGHRTYDPGQTAWSIKCEIDAIRRKDAKVALEAGK